MRFIAKHWQSVLLGLFCFTPVLWFVGRDPNVLINGLDTNFPLDPLVWFGRRLFVWNNIVNAGTDFSSSTAGLFFHFIQLVPFVLGFSLKNVEIFSMIFWFSMVVASSFILARSITPRSKLAQIVFVALYAFNVYLFNTWENVKVANLSLVASLPLFIAVVYLWINNTIALKRALLVLLIASILAMGSGINPAYFLVTALAVLIEGFMLKNVKIPALSILILSAVNLFWILPLFNFLLVSGTSNLEGLGLTNWLESLSKDTSITNVVRLQGAWDWYALDKYGMPQYLPYTLNYLYNPPFVIFSFAAPVLAVVSFLFANAKKKFWYVFFGILAVLGIFLGVGAHQPTGRLFVFLYEHIPFLSFFRSPWYIFTPLLVISYSGLIGLLFEELHERFINKPFGWIVGVLGFIFLVLYGIYNYPLINGKIFRPDKDGFYVSFPQYLWDAKEWLDKSESSENKRIIAYPDDDLETFSWGYKGTESILGLFADREIIAPSFNVSSKTFGFLLKDFYSHVKRGEYESAAAVLNFFGADTIFYKKDSPTLSPAITENIKKIADSTDFGEWSFMKVRKEINKKIYLPKAIYNNLSYPDESVFQVPLLADGAAVVNGTIDSEVAKIPESGSYLSLARAYDYGSENNELSNIQKYGWTLPKDGVFNLSIEKLEIGAGGVSVKIDGIEINRQLIGEREAFIEIGPLKLEKGNHVAQITYPKQENLMKISDFSQYIAGTNLREEEYPSDTKRTLMAFNPANEEKTIKLPVENFNPFIRYAVGFDYKYIYGSVPILDIVQSAPTAPVKSHSVYTGSSIDWESKHDIFRPVETNSKLEIIIRMPPNNFGGKSKMYFENIFIERIYDNKVFVVEKAEETVLPDSIAFTKVNPVKYEIAVTVSEKKNSGVNLVFLEGFSKDWVLTPKDNREGFKTLHYMVNGYANGWYIPQRSGSLNYVIYYRPQRIFQIGLAVSLATILSILTLSFVKRKQ